MNDVLLRALAPVLRDIAATGAPRPRLEDNEWGDPTIQATAMMYGRLTGMGVAVNLAESPLERIVRAADAAQEFVIDELWGSAPTNWPRCPGHPWTHPLRPTINDKTAVWMCPVDLRAYAGIGELELCANPSSD